MRNVKKVVLLMAGAVLSGSAPHALHADSPARGYGVHTTYNLDSLGGPGGHYPVIQDQLGVQHVRVLARWSQIQAMAGTAPNWAKLDRHVDAAEDAGIELIVTIGTSPTWLNGSADEWSVPQGPPKLQEWITAYRSFVNAMASRYRGRVRHWELWNEPNLKVFWEPLPNAAAYAQWAQAIHDEIKSVDSSAEIAFGALVHLDVGALPDSIAGKTFLQQMYDLGLTPEIVSVHPYALLLEEPDFEDKDHLSNTFRDVETIWSVMLANDPTPTDNQIWITEFGWRACLLQPPPSCPPFPACIDEATRADFIERSVEIIETEYPFVAKAIWFLDRERISPQSLACATAGYGLINNDPALATPAGEIWQETALQIPVIINGFEQPGDFVLGPTGWSVWTNNPLGPPGTAAVVSHSSIPRPRGGMQELLRMASGTMSGSPPPAGLYALSPPIPVEAGRNYTLTLFSRCDGCPGPVDSTRPKVRIVPYNASGDILLGTSIDLPIDSLAFSQTQLGPFRMPAETAYARVRFRLESSNAVLDIDLIKLGWDRE